MNNYDIGMEQNKANYIPLTPLSFLDRIKDVYPDYEAIVYKQRKYNWKQVYDRCTQFASALTKIGIGDDETVSDSQSEGVCSQSAHAHPLLILNTIID